MVFDINIQRIVGPHHTNLVAKPARLKVRSLQRTLKFVWCEIYVWTPGLVNFIMIIIYMYNLFLTSATGDEIRILRRMHPWDRN